VFSFTQSKYIQWVPKFKKFDPWILTTPLLGVFVIHEMGLAKNYRCAKFEVTSFTYSKTEVVLKFKNSAPGPRPFLGYFIVNEMGLSNLPNLKFQASPVPKVRRWWHAVAG